MEYILLAVAIPIAAALGILIYGSISLHKFSFSFLRRAEQDVRERENHARSVENRMIMLCEHILTEGHGRTFTALEKLADPKVVSSARQQMNQSELNKTVRTIADAVADPFSNRTSVQPVSRAVMGIPSFNEESGQ
jgi:hypothetical protein